MIKFNVYFQFTANQKCHAGKFIKRLRLFGDSVSPWNKLFGDSAMKRKTTREFSGNCILFPESPNKLFVGLRLFGDTGEGTFAMWIRSLICFSV